MLALIFTAMFVFGCSQTQNFSQTQSTYNPATRLFGINLGTSTAEVINRFGNPTWTTTNSTTESFNYIYASPIMVFGFRNSSQQVIMILSGTNSVSVEGCTIGTTTAEAQSHLGVPTNIGFGASTYIWEYSNKNIF